MSIDTAAKRFSAINVGSPWRGIAYFPTGTVDAPERQALAHLYSGIAASGAVSQFIGFIANIRLARNSGIHTFDLSLQFDTTTLYHIFPVLPAGMSLDVNTGMLTIDTAIAGLGITGPYVVSGT